MFVQLEKHLSTRDGRTYYSAAGKGITPWGTKDPREALPISKGQTIEVFWPNGTIKNAVVISNGGDALAITITHNGMPINVPLEQLKVNIARIPTASAS